MKAVNLIPSDAARGGRRPGRLPTGPAYVVVALLGIALAFVSIYVLTSNTISSRKAKLASLQQQAAQEQAVATRLTNYAKFAQLAQARVQTVRQLASTRFDWHAALSDLSKVVPANTSLQSLLGTVAPGVSVNGPGGSVGGAGSTSTLRGDISAPAFELQGCTKTQDDVARLMSRMRVMNGVTRVTLADSLKQDVAGGAAAAPVASGGGAGQSCPPNTPGFDLVVFFQPLPGAPATTGTAAGATAPTASTAAAGTSTTGTTSTTTTSGATTTTPGTATTPGAGVPPTTTTPVSTSAPGGSK